VPKPTNFDETPALDEGAPASTALRFVADAIGLLISLTTVALPYVEKSWLAVLPVTARIRGSLMPVAVLACVVAVLAGVATARQTAGGLAMGWFALCLFLATTIVLYGVVDFWPHATSGLYVVFFASFSLAIASFLTRRGQPAPRQ